MSIRDNLNAILSTLPPSVTLCAVSKFQPFEAIEELYEQGQRIFGESRPQEMAAKAQKMVENGRNDVQWHFIGHLQTNKVGLVVGAASLIQSVDSERLLVAISKEAVKIGQVVDVLLQVHIAEEQTKQGLSSQEVEEIMGKGPYDGVRIVGLMGMATYTDDMEQVGREFEFLRQLYDRYAGFTVLSMGMSGDYEVAIAHHTTLVRVGTSIFGSRAGCS